MISLDYVGKELRDTCWIFRFFFWYSSFFLLRMELSGQHCQYCLLFGSGKCRSIQFICHSFSELFLDFSLEQEEINTQVGMRCFLTLTGLYQ